MALTLTDATFQKEIAEFKGVSLVDFWDTWCGPCRIQGPIVDVIATKFANNKDVKIGKLDVDENGQTAMAFHVMSIPTMVIFKDGQVQETIVGLRSEQDLVDKLNYYINS